MCHAVLGSLTNNSRNDFLLTESCPTSSVIKTLQPLQNLPDSFHNFVPRLLAIRVYFEHDFV
jgi:hypothetical protein